MSEAGTLGTPLPKLTVWSAWTDGASIDNPGASGLGFVIVAPDGSRREGYQGLGQATNNIAELTAILRVAEALPTEARLVLHTDSKYAIGVLGKGWKATKNVELIANTKSALAKLANVSFEWVKGHGDVVENIVADKLALRGAEANAVTAVHITAVAAKTSELYQVAVIEAAAVRAATTKAADNELVLVIAPVPPLPQKK